MRQILILLIFALNVTKCDWPFCEEPAVKTVKTEYVHTPFNLSICARHLELHEKADSSWKVLVSTDGFGETHLLFGESVDIFRQSLMAIQGGNIYGSTILARSALEAGLFARLSVSSPKYGVQNGQVWLSTYSPTHNWDDAKLKQMIEECKRNKYLSSDFHCKSMKVKEWGDYVAHMAQRKQRNPMKFSREVKYDGYDIVYPFITDKEAEESLEYVSEILHQLISDFYEDTKPTS